MPCERRPFIPEGSDTQLIFHVTEETSCGEETNVDLTAYTSVVLKIKYSDAIVEYQGTVDQTNKYLVTFDILSESTAGRAGEFKAELWGINGAQKHRFNKNTIVGDVLASIDIPEGTTVSN